MSSYSLDSVKSSPTLIDLVPVAAPAPSPETSESDFRDHLDPPAPSDEQPHASNEEVRREHSDESVTSTESESVQDQQTTENNESRSQDGETNQGETSSEDGESAEAATIEPVVAPNETQELTDIVLDGSRVQVSGDGSEPVNPESSEKSESGETITNAKELAVKAKPTTGELSDGQTDRSPTELDARDSHDASNGDEVVNNRTDATQAVAAENAESASNQIAAAEPVVAAFPEKVKVTREASPGQRGEAAEGDRPIAPLPTSFDKTAWGGQGGSNPQSNSDSNPSEPVLETPTESGTESVSSSDRAPRLREQLQPQAHRQGPTGLRPTEQARFVNRVARAFESMGNREGELRIRLSPPELGSMRLSVRVENGALAARLETDTPMARQALLDGLPVLRERLAEQGIRIEQFSVDIADRHPGQRPGDDIQQHDQRRQSGSPREQHEDSETEQRRQRPTIQQNDNLDIVV